MKKIKIIKCSGSNWWYKDLIGEVMSIEKESNEDYIVTDKYKRNENNELISTGMILKSDCELI